MAYSNIQLAARRWEAEVFQGKIKDPTGRSPYFVVKFGSNEDVGATEEGVQPQGGNFVWPTSALPVRIKAGGNTADTAAGTGARTVLVQGIDSNGDLASETLTTAGASASANSSTSFWRIFRAQVVTSGTYTGANTGIIDIENTSGQLLVRLPAGHGATDHCSYTVPRAHSAALVSVTMHVGSGKTADIRVFTRDQFDVVSAPFYSPRDRMEFLSVSAGITQIELNPAIQVNEKTDIWINAKSSAGGTIVSCVFGLYIFPSGSAPT